MANIRIFNGDTLIADVPAKAKFKHGTTRISVFAAATQRQLDSLLAEHRAATRAEIDGPMNNGFVFKFAAKNGISSVLWS